MKIINLSFSDLQGGASRASYRIHRAMLSKGVSSKMSVQNKVTDDASVQYVASGVFSSLVAKVMPYLDRATLSFYGINPKGSVWSPGWLNFWKADRWEEVRAADAIILYWICNGFLGIRTIGRLLALNKPVIWRLSDMWPFTGGCHYSGACARYQYLCGRCPQLNSSYKNDLSYRVLQKKKELWKIDGNSRLSIVCPSRWIAKKAKKSALFRGASIEVIPTGVDIKNFKPINPETARDILNLPQKKRLILFGADKGLDDKRKGGDLLYSVLLELKKYWKSKDDEPEMVLLGTWKQYQKEEYPLKVHPLGSFINDLSLPLVYSACDLFISLSVEDNMPNTVIESLACGTPCVAFDTGGIPELIEHQVNGYLCEYKNKNDFVKGIIWAIDSKEHNRGISLNARIQAKRKFNITSAIEKYLALIGSMQ